MIRVTVEDLSGEQPPDSATIEDDYLITCAGSCYVANIQTYPKSGTHILTIKGRKTAVDDTPSRGRSGGAARCVCGALDSPNHRAVCWQAERSGQGG